MAWAESRPASIERTFGYHRAEVMGAMLGALVLWLGSRRNRRADDAFRHLISDFLGSVGVVAAAVLAQFNGWTIADPLVSIGIAALIAASSRRLVLKVFFAIMEETPERLDLYALCAEIEDVPSVTLIHDVHA